MDFQLIAPLILTVVTVILFPLAVLCSMWGCIGKLRLVL
jgi:hypothetical protein